MVLFFTAVLLNCLYSKLYEYDSSKPLILTDYINEGEIEKGRQLSRVEPFLGDDEGYSGYFRVSDECERNMFFWFLTAQNKNTSAPLIVWLQGGPGASSLYGLFEENGPYVVDSNLEIHPRNITWTKEYNVIYIDNPVGTGYSFSHKECYLTNEGQVGLYLAEFMRQFLLLFPHLVNNPLYVTGESYAGKYVPSMVWAIIEMNELLKSQINIVGMAIGDGLSDPINMMDYGSVLYGWGLISEEDKAKFDSLRDSAVENIKQHNFVEAFRIFDLMLNGDLSPYPTLFQNTTGLTDYFNLYSDNEANVYFPRFLNNNSERIHVGDVPFGGGNDVEMALINDIAQSVSHVVGRILDHPKGIKCLFYSGQFDIIVPYAATCQFLSKLEWRGKDQFANAERKVWKSSRVNGYIKSAHNLIQILVRNAGHMVPTDQPEATMEMIDNFINNRQFY